MNESTTIGKLRILKEKGIGAINDELKQRDISIEDVINIETQPTADMHIVWFRKRGKKFAVRQNMAKGGVRGIIRENLSLEISNINTNHMNDIRIRLIFDGQPIGNAIQIRGKEYLIASKEE